MNFKYFRRNDYVDAESRKGKKFDYLKDYKANDQKQNEKDQVDNL